MHEARYRPGFAIVHGGWSLPAITLNRDIL